MMAKLDFQDVLDGLAELVAAKVCERINDGGHAVRARLMTVEQAAVYLGRTKDAVQHLIASGKISTVRTDRRVMLDLQDLDAWIQENKQTAL